MPVAGDADAGAGRLAADGAAAPADGQAAGVAVAGGVAAGGSVSDVVAATGGGAILPMYSISQCGEGIALLTSCALS